MNRILKVVSLVILLSLACFATYKGTSYFLEKKIQREKNFKSYSFDKSFYLQNGDLYVLNDASNSYVKVPGDFSQMSMSDYWNENYKSNSKTTGGIYFYYKSDNKIYLVRTENFKDWSTKELTSEEIGVPENAKIKYVRISGSYGYIFFIDENGKGSILKSSTSGDYWGKVETSFDLNDNCELQFLNQFGMTVDGFLTVPNVDSSKCDLYFINNDSEQTFNKIDVSSLHYYHMPYYLGGSSSSKIVLEVGKDKNDFDVERFIGDISSNTWVPSEQYFEDLEKEQDDATLFISNYNKMVDDLDDKIFLKDFENYPITSYDIKISQNQAKNIAEIGFEESAKRIASEGITDTEKESQKIEEVYPNNYFTRKYYEYDKTYNTYKRKAYVFTKQNDMGNGVSVFVDVYSGLIIGGDAFGD